MLNLFFEPQDIVVFVSKYPIFKGFDTRYSGFWYFTLFRTRVIIVAQLNNGTPSHGSLVAAVSAACSGQSTLKTEHSPS